MQYIYILYLYIYIYIYIFATLRNFVHFIYIYIYLYIVNMIMKTMCPSRYHHNDFVAANALAHIMYRYTLLIPMNIDRHIDR